MGNSALNPWVQIQRVGERIQNPLKPPAPPKLPPAPPLVDEQAAGIIQGLKARRRRTAGAGAGSPILTGGLGASGMAPTEGKSLLGL